MKQQEEQKRESTIPVELVKHYQFLAVNSVTLKQTARPKEDKLVQLVLVFQFTMI